MRLEYRFAHLHPLIGDLELADPVIVVRSLT
jgi:hypothetical protein